MLGPSTSHLPKSSQTHLHVHERKQSKSLLLSSVDVNTSKNSLTVCLFMSFNMTEASYASVEMH